MRLWAVDPGDVHVGFAEFVDEPEQREGAHEGWHCTRAWEKDPDNAIDDIAAALLQYHVDVLVVEEFRLYPDKAMQQTGSTMPTCELIGQIKWAHRLDSRRRRDTHAHDTDNPHTDPIPLIMQPAAIQTPTKGVLRRRGIKSVAKQCGPAIRAAGGEGDHALSAELHGWHYLIRGKQITAAT